jgi:hypothetical protein
LRFDQLNPIALWFGQNANNLLIGLVGTQDTVTVANWFASDDYMIDVIQADSMLLLKSQMEQVLQDMAALGTYSGETGTWTQEQQQELASLISVYWEPQQ